MKNEVNFNLREVSNLQYVNFNDKSNNKVFEKDFEVRGFPFVMRMVAGAYLTPTGFHVRKMAVKLPKGVKFPKTLSKVKMCLLMNLGPSSNSFPWSWDTGTKDNPEIHPIRYDGKTFYYDTDETYVSADELPEDNDIVYLVPVIYGNSAVVPEEMRSFDPLSDKVATIPQLRKWIESNKASIEAAF